MEAHTIEIDTDWINEFECNDKEYKQFYQTNVNGIKLFLLYVDRSNTIVHIKKNILDISNNSIHKEVLISVLRKNMDYNERKYRPISILQYNMNLSPEDIKNFIQNTENYNFLTAKNTIESIHWDNTIKLFADLNSLYIIFYEKWCTNHKGTRKIYIESKKKLKRGKTKKKQIKNKAKV